MAAIKKHKQTLPQLLPILNTGADNSSSGTYGLTCCQMIAFQWCCWCPSWQRPSCPFQCRACFSL